MRIVVVQSSAMAHHPRHHYRLAVALADQGHEVTMLSQPDRASGHRPGVPLAELPQRRTRFTRMLSGPATMLRAWRRRPDLVYVVSLDLLPWAVALKMMTRVRVLYDSSEQYDEYMLTKTYLPGPVRRALRLLVRRVEPALGARLHGVTAAVPATQEKFARAGARVTLVRNFPPASVARPGSGPRGPFTWDVIMAGTVLPDAVPTLVRTVSELARLEPAGARWLIACRGMLRPQQEMLEAALERAGVRDRVDLRFNLPFLDVQELLERSRVGLISYPDIPYYDVVLPLRVFEYMAIGLPFVSPALPLIADLVEAEGEPAPGLLATSGDPSAYAAAIATLLRDEGLQAAMTDRGPELVRKRYNWELESRGLVELVEQLARA